MAGGVRVPVTLRPPRRSASTSDAAARRGHARGPGSSCSTRRTTRPARSSPATSSPPSRALAVEHDLLVITDEVYEHLVFDGEHVPLAHAARHARAHGHDQLGRARRSRSPAGRSAGSAAAPELVAAVRTAKQFLTYVSGGPFQYADRRGARACRTTTSPALRDDLRTKRDLLSDGLAELGFDGLPVRRAPTSSPPTSAPSARPTASSSAARLPERAGVVAIPSAVFYDDRERGPHPASASPSASGPKC